MGKQAKRRIDLNLRGEAIMESELERALHGIKNFSIKGKTINCRACRCRFVVGEWCFYDLCGICFDAWDTAKMAVRFGQGIELPYEDWLRSRRAT